ncbi:hypothetical protein [Ralstonia sp. GX3-BWBA]|uniref:hypothetical protein n=1 Tax=Ralstonia sp. GX3-BWBA TaxID=2219865 RepID=UPI0013A6F1FE|nr:hypothetical protein [Ralstonia sp. GX3-BWBA]
MSVFLQSAMPLGPVLGLMFLLTATFAERHEAMEILIAAATTTVVGCRQKCEDDV